MKIFISLFIIFSLFPMSCSKSPVAIQKQNPCRSILEDVLEPHAKGNFWERVQYAYSGGQIEPGLTDTGRIVIENVTALTVEGMTYKVGVGRVILPGELPEPATSLFWNGPNGLYSLGLIAPEDTVITEPRLRYKYPVSVGESWATYTLIYDPFDKKISVKDTLTYTCVAINEPFITPVDTFNTIVYHYYYKPVDDVLEYWHTFQYFSPGVGPVGTEVYGSFDTTYSYANRKFNDQKLRLEMTDYCLH